MSCDWAIGTEDCADIVGLEEGVSSEGEGELEKEDG